MNTLEALSKIRKISGKTFKELGLADDQINKGGSGQALLLAIGLTLTSDLLDTVDGEIKSTMFVNNRPKETVWVTQLLHTLEEIETKVEWEQTSLYENFIELFLYLYIKIRKIRLNGFTESQYFLNI